MNDTVGALESDYAALIRPTYSFGVRTIATTDEHEDGQTDMTRSARYGDALFARLRALLHARLAQS